jgi:PI-3-kinase-related kinase SMG-1
MVAEIRKRFELLLLRPAELVVDEIGDQATSVNTSSMAGSSDDVLTPGQMLLMGFNGLFEKLQLEGNALIAALDTLDTPHCWKKVDQLWEAKAMAVSTDAC